MFQTWPGRSSQLKILQGQHCTCKSEFHFSDICAVTARILSNDGSPRGFSGMERAGLQGYLPKSCVSAPFWTVVRKGKVIGRRTVASHGCCFVNPCESPVSMPPG